MTITEAAERHYAWLREQGWMQGERPLELLMLVASEVGEAANECRTGTPTPLFGSELADIILRTLGIAQHYGIDIEAEVIRKIAQNRKNGNRGRTV
jgi:NTP pyrophosphatase (non-canonical NTP hydrolase)